MRMVLETHMQKISVIAQLDSHFTGTNKCFCPSAYTRINSKHGRPLN